MLPDWPIAAVNRQVKPKTRFHLVPGRRTAARRSAANRCPERCRRSRGHHRPRLPRRSPGDYRGVGPGWPAPATRESAPPAVHRATHHPVHEMSGGQGRALGHESGGRGNTGVSLVPAVGLVVLDGIHHRIVMPTDVEAPAFPGHEGAFRLNCIGCVVKRLEHPDRPPDRGISKNIPGQDR